MGELLINNRICPKPQQWNKLWEIIQSKANEKVSAPLILAAWWETTDEEKLRRFKYHHDYAEKLSLLNEIQIFLQTLNETDWHHNGE